MDKAILENHVRKSHGNYEADTTDGESQNVSWGATQAQSVGLGESKLTNGR